MDVCKVDERMNDQQLGFPDLSYTNIWQMNGWMNEWFNELMNECMNESMN